MIPTNINHEQEKPVMTQTLPPDPDNQNDDRAAWALHAVKAFQDATGSANDTAIGDLLADLMHLCDRMGDRYQRWEAALSQGQMHYEAESGEGAI